MKKVTVVLTLFLLVMLTCSGCGEKNPLYQQVRDALDREDPDNLKITIYYMDPDVQYRAYPTLEQLTDPDSVSVTVYNLDGDRIYSSLQIIKNELKEYMIVPTEPAKHEKARVYYVLETKDGEKTLELLLEGVEPTCVYFNGTEVECNAIYYRIIKACIGAPISRGLHGNYK